MVGTVTTLRIFVAAGLQADTITIIVKGKKPA